MRFCLCCSSLKTNRCRLLKGDMRIVLLNCLDNITVQHFCVEIPSKLAQVRSVTDDAFYDAVRALALRDRAARFAVTVLTHGLDCLRSEARRIISPVATEQSWMTPTKFRKTAVVPVRCDPFASGFDCKGCEARIGDKVAFYSAFPVMHHN